MRYKFDVEILNQNPFQVQLDTYEYSYREYDEFVSVPDSLGEKLEFELRDYYEGNFFTFSGLYPDLRGPGGGGYSASSFVGNYNDFRVVDTIGGGKDFSMYFDKNILDSVPGSIRKISSDIKFIVESAFKNSTPNKNEVYIDPIFTRDNKKRAESNQIRIKKVNGVDTEVQNPNYTPNGKTYSIPISPDFELISSRESPTDPFSIGQYYITYLIKEIVPTPKKEETIQDQKQDENEPVTLSEESKISSYVFNVEKLKTFSNINLGDLVIVESKLVEESEDDFIFIDNDEDLLDDEFREESFEGENELIEESKKREDEQSQPIPDDVPDKNENLSVDYNDVRFVGGAWKNYDINNIISEINRTTHKPNSKFTESLRKILHWIKQDKDITDVREASYLLATAYAEAGYSLQRWEADYVCSGTGIPYGSNGPCTKALNYYRSSKNKKNYYDLGTDSRGLPYFGRGLIQLTGKSNYEKYGKKIGVNLVVNGDLALKEDNSYKIAVIYLIGRTFKHVRNNDLIKARKSVNGGTNGLSEVNSAYYDWLKIFQKLV
jgi:hypothetical protein